MTVPRQIKFAYALVAWMSAGTVALSVLNALSLETFYVLSFMGLLVVADVTASEVTPSWRLRVKWLVVVALIAYIAVIAARLSDILAF